MRRVRVLVVDGEEASRTHLRRYLERKGYVVECVDRVNEALERLANSPPSLVIADVMLPGISALETMRSVAPEARLIALSATAHGRTILKATRLQAADYLMKPLKDEELQEALQGLAETDFALVSLGKRTPDVPRGKDAACFNYSSTPALAHIAEIAGRVADSDIPVLILGESGVGKGVLAQYIHNASARRHRPLVKVNCAALPRDLMESELFGYDRGAFTGAVDNKQGKFELANGGSILLDEIGEMSPALQAKLLHVLQDQEYSRLGATKTIRVNSRIIATTNKRLEAAVSSGEFRGDLLYRLNVVRLEIPPLREHMADVPALCDYFLQKYRTRYGVDDSAELPPRLQKVLYSYHWPGNVRQLENAIKQFLILREEELVVRSLRESETGTCPEPRPTFSPTLPKQSPSQTLHSLSLKGVAAKAAEEAEKEIILRALNEKRWNRKGVARDLGISYKTLLFKLRRWNAQKAS